MKKFTVLGIGILIGINIAVFGEFFIPQKFKFGKSPSCLNYPEIGIVVHISRIAGTFFNNSIKEKTVLLPIPVNGYIPSYKFLFQRLSGKIIPLTDKECLNIIRNNE